MYLLSGQPGTLERSTSADTLLPIRQSSRISQRDGTSSSPGANILAEMAQAMAYSTVPTFGPLTGRYPFPPTGAAHRRVSVLIAEGKLVLFVLLILFIYESREPRHRLRSLRDSFVFVQGA